MKAKFMKFLDTLSRDEMRSIAGGYGSGSCGYRDRDGYSYCGLSRAEAQHMASGGGYWCCDSCASVFVYHEIL